MPFLLALLKRYWEQLAVAAIIGLYTAFIWHQGGNAERAELAALRSADEVRAGQHEALIERINDDYRKSLAARDAYWANWMQQHPAKPAVKVASSLCGNKAADDRLSASLEQYLTGIGHVRSELASFLERADAQQAQLICVVDYAQKDAVIH